MEGDSYHFKPIAYARSCYIHCQGVPRQPGLVPLAKSRLEIEEWVPPPAFEDLNQYSHVWILFVFHMNTNTSTLLKSNNTKGITFPVLLFNRIHRLGKSPSSSTKRKKYRFICHSHSPPSLSDWTECGKAGGHSRVGKEAIYHDLKFVFVEKELTCRYGHCGWISHSGYQTLFAFFRSH